MKKFMLAGLKLTCFTLLCTTIACSDGPGTESNELADACVTSELIAQCPAGSNPSLSLEATSACEASGEAILYNEQGYATASCAGTSLCRVVCQFASPCVCGVAEVSRDGVICMECPDDFGCGNGTCDPGEDPSSCAMDCGAICQTEETRCGNDGGLQSCKLQGRWEHVACREGEI